MIDSVLKGTGNSRFLKSAVPAGTSWADALAMLQSGTFPIDFNGINTDGFQQVGTPLNKANLLKDATAAQIGLPPSTTPDGMFQALGNTGELHVWRKTVKNAADVPAGYNLGVKTTKTILNTTGDSVGVSTIYYSSSVVVSDSGKVLLENPTSVSVDIYTSSLPIVGKFFYIDLSSVQTSDLIKKKIYFVPSGTDISVDDSPKAFSGVVQEVTGYAKVPAGTTTTYPVSTNPNAYQEGDDAKPAGYTLGEATNGDVISDMSGTADFEITTGTAVNVSDDGAVALGGSVTTLSSTYKLSKIVSDLKTYGSGKFCSIVCTYNKQYTSGKFLTGIWYIPSDATMSVDTTITGAAVNLSVVGAKPVTGYAAIPAGTTIEYLGKLGDKARLQKISYVGTGTYGKRNPNSLTFDFAPKVVIVNGHRVTASYTNTYSIILSPQSGDGVSMLGTDRGYVYWVICEAIDRTVSWYAANYENQLNESGMKYVAVAIG